MANVAQEIPSSQPIFAQRDTSVDGPSYQQLNGNQNFGAARLMRDELVQTALKLRIFICREGKYHAHDHPACEQKTDSSRC